jgi:hypothetical protein
VQRIRNRLIGEHLGVSADAVTSELGRVGSLRALVDARAHADRTLCRVDLGGPAEPTSEVLKAAADPDEPFGFFADTRYRRARRRMRSLGVALRSLLPVRLSSLLSTWSGRRRRQDAEFG